MESGGRLPSLWASGGWLLPRRKNAITRNDEDQEEDKREGRIFRPSPSSSARARSTFQPKSLSSAPLTAAMHRVGRPCLKRFCTAAHQAIFSLDDDSFSFVQIGQRTWGGGRNEEEERETSSSALASSGNQARPSALKISHKCRNDKASTNYQQWLSKPSRANPPLPPNSRRTPH